MPECTFTYALAQMASSIESKCLFDLNNIKSESSLYLIFAGLIGTMVQVLRIIILKSNSEQFVQFYLDYEKLIHEKIAETNHHQSVYDGPRQFVVFKKQKYLFINAVTY
jgi:hypothetical protein